MFGSRTQYGLSTVVDIARNQGSGPVTIGDIARRMGIPRKFLEQILSSLKKEGIIRSIRGRKGGYFLAREEKDIMVIQVLEACEGPLILAKGDAVRFPAFWKQMENAMRDYLSISLEEFIRRHVPLDNSSLMYHI